MASGTITLLDSSAYYDSRISWSSTAYPSSNRSKVTIKVQVYNNTGNSITAGHWGYFKFSTSSSGGNSSVLDETEFDVSKTIPVKTWTTIDTLTFYASHKDDGTRKLYLWGMVTNDLEYQAEYEGWGITLDTIIPAASISSAPDFTDEDNPTMKYSVQSISSTTKLEACISFDGSKDDIPYRDIDKNTTSYTFNFTEAERNILRNATLNGSNEKTVYFYIRSTANGVTKTARLGKTLTIINAEPELSVFLMDTNATTTALTGDSLTTVIKGYSNVSYETNSSGLKGATITGLSAVNGSKTLTTASGTFAGAESGKFTFTATDNRGLTTKKEITLKLIDYFRPTCSQEVKIDKLQASGTLAKITIVAKGEWCSKHFGAAHNALNVAYRYKTGSGSWSAWSGTDYVTDNNSYSVTFTINNLDYSKSYTVQSRAVDSLSSVVTTEYTLRLTPVFDWGESDFNFNVPVSIDGNLTVKGNLVVEGEQPDAPADYVIATGSEAMGTNGTWYWEKWKSGKATCYGVRNFGNMAVSTAWGDLYRSAIFTQPLPTGLFNSMPSVITIDFSNGGMSAWSVKHEQSLPSASDTGSFMVVRAASATLSQVYLSFNVIGRWK